MTPLSYSEYATILQAELLPALGCTEPIAIALAAATARSLLGSRPEKIELTLSGNMIKNAYSVHVPNARGEKGIPVAAALGAVGGDERRGLQLLETIGDAEIAAAGKMVDAGAVSVKLLEGRPGLYIDCIVEGNGHTAEARVEDTHTNFTYLARDGVAQLDYSAQATATAPQDRSLHDRVEALKERFRFHDIWEAAQAFTPERSAAITAILETEIEYNSAIGEEGIQNRWGQSVGQTLLASQGEDPFNVCIAYAAAGSDARMAGCSKPVIINSGSGNQGMTLSIPLIVRARQLGKGHLELLRALFFANCLALYCKIGIGSLSAYCGAVSAASASGSALAMLEGDGEEIAEKTLINALGTTSGLICDGASSSCAAKIAISLQTAKLARDMAKSDRVFPVGEGIRGRDADEMLSYIGRLANPGMQKTDVEILNIMLGASSKA